jgi:hypothetical protein
MGGGVGEAPAVAVGVLGGFAASTVDIVPMLNVSSNKRIPTRLIVRPADLDIVCSSGILLHTEHRFKIERATSSLIKEFARFSINQRSVNSITLCETFPELLLR